jgi:1-pyrroline-5-carboxylate dehydrogenase
MAAAAPKITYTSTPEEIEAMHSVFDEALERFEANFGKEYPVVINGEEITGRGTFDVVAPADTSLVLARMQKATRDDVDAAVAAARAAYPAWSGRPWQERVAIIQNAAEAIRERKFDPRRDHDP